MKNFEQEKGEKWEKKGRRGDKGDMETREKRESVLRETGKGDMQVDQKEWRGR